MRKKGAAVDDGYRIWLLLRFHGFSLPDANDIKDHGEHFESYEIKVK